MAGWISCLRNQPQSALGRRGAEPAQTPVVRSKEIMQHRGVAIQHEASAGEWRYSLRWAARRPAAKPERDCSFVQSVGSTIALIASCIAVQKVRVDIAVDASVGCAAQSLPSWDQGCQLTRISNLMRTRRTGRNSRLDIAIRQRAVFLPFSPRLPAGRPPVRIAASPPAWWDEGHMQIVYLADKRP